MSLRTKLNLTAVTLVAALLSAVVLAPPSFAAAAPGSGLAVGKVTGELREPGGAAPGGAARAADAAAGMFEGQVTITKIHSHGGKLTADGVLEGTARPTKGPK